jgi:hypothetical protein
LPVNISASNWLGAFAGAGGNTAPAARIRLEIEKWGKVVRNANLRIE